MNWLWNTIFMLIKVFSCITDTTAFKVTDKFKYCGTHGNKVIWDLSESCDKPLKVSSEAKETYHIIIKELMKLMEKACNVQINTSE